ncbi:hypothetical protein N9I81_00870 [Planktomarina temperata]|nr:hypothetical protein [Planktomarina temperata]
MTSTFILHLSNDSIDLERADAWGHWHRLGSVSMDSENLTKALSHLRQTAVPGAADALEVLVALPSDQIKLLDLDHSDTSSAALQHALAGQTPYEFHELYVDRLPTPQGQSIAAIAQETLDEADSFTKAFGFKAVGYVALPGCSWGNNFCVFQRPGAGTLNRPRPYIAATQEAGATDLTPLAALKEGARSAPQPPIANPTPAASPTPEFSAGAADEAAPTPQISAHPTVQADRAPLSPSLGAAIAAAPAPQVTETQTVPPETLPAESTTSQASQSLRIAQRFAGILQLLRPRPRKPKEPNLTTLQAQVGGKPIYLGLILTTLLVLFMFTVAALAATLGREKIYVWLGLSPSQVEMTAGLPADPIGQAIEISLQPLDVPSAPAERAAVAPQAQDDAVQLQKADVALKDPEHDAEPAIGLTAQEPPAVRAVTISPVTEPTAAPPADTKGLIAAQDPNLQNEIAPRVLDTPWLMPDPLPDKHNRAPDVAQDQREGPADATPTRLAEPAILPPVTAAIEQTDQTAAAAQPDAASPEEANPLASFRPMPRPAGLPPPVRPTTLPEGKSLTRSLRPQSRPRTIELAALLPAPVVAKPSEIQAPTATSRKAVARSATRTNVINLRNINLIGITGTNRLRNALVRLPNGQVVKVRIGDRLDGGRVTDISTKSLTYAKSGRSITLDMPRG